MPHERFNVAMACHDTTALRGPTNPDAGVALPVRKRILLVDDELDLWWWDIAEKLPSARYEVDSVKDGEEGWQALQAKHYDLLVTDNKMPGISGLELIQKMRSAGIALPVILVSSLVPVEELTRRQDLKIDDTLEKPITTAELATRMDRILTSRDHTLAMP